MWDDSFILNSRWLNTHYQMPDRLLAICTHREEEEDATSQVGPCKDCTWEYRKPAMALGVRLCGEESEVTLCSHGGCDWLVYIISQFDREVKPIRLKTR